MNNAVSQPQGTNIANGKWKDLYSMGRWSENKSGNH